jgi:hypothetical protein
VPSDLEALTVQLRDAYARVWGTVQAEETRLLADFTAANRSQRLRLLRDTRRSIEGLMDVADELALRWAARELPDAYQLGARQAAGVAGQAVSFRAVDVDAVNQLVLDGRDSLLTATRNVKRSTKELVNRLATQHMTEKLVRGQTATQAAAGLRAELEGHGITAVTYADGSRHGLAEYADMAILTRTGELYQVGGFDQTKALGIGWMEIFDGLGCGLSSHDDPRKANGLILPTDEARLYPLAHPRCGRSTSPRPDIQSKRDAEHAKPSTTAAQRADQEQAEAARAQSVAARAQRRRLQAAQQRNAAGVFTDAGTQLSPAAARAAARRTSAASKSSRRASEAIARHITQASDATQRATTPQRVATALSRGLQAPLGRPVPVDLAGIDLGFAKPYAAALLDLAGRFPQAGLKRIRSRPVIGGQTNAYAGTLSVPGGGSVIDVSQWWHGEHSPDVLRRELRNDMEVGFHPKGSEDPRSVIIHEFGHVLDRGTLGDQWKAADPATGLPSLDEQIDDYARSRGVDPGNPVGRRNLIATEVSQYGLADTSELVAEAFTDVELNGAGASGLSRLIHDRLVAALRGSLAQEGGVA